MDREKIFKFIEVTKEIFIFTLKNPGLMALVVCFIPLLLAHKINEKIYGEKIVKPVAREPNKNKEIEEWQDID